MKRFAPLFVVVGLALGGCTTQDIQNAASIGCGVLPTAGAIADIFATTPELQNIQDEIQKAKAVAAIFCKALVPRAKVASLQARGGGKLKSGETLNATYRGRMLSGTVQ